MGKRSLEGAQTITKHIADKRDRESCKNNKNGYCLVYERKCENCNCSHFEVYVKSSKVNGNQ